MAHGAERVQWFGVRHHSPAAARLVAALIADRRPDAVLIEGPYDFDDRLDELALDHVLPIAIYSSVVLPDGRRAAYHPFCVYSPEWQALVRGREVGARVRFIDLPWSAIAGEAESAHRYGDRELRGAPGLNALLERLGVDTFDDAWDRLVEVDPDLDLATYRARVEALGGELRPDDPELVSDEDHRREAFMAARVAETLREVDGEVVVVCGAFHTPALRALVEAGAPDVEAPVPRDGQTIALTPYDYASLDGLSGYDAGMPNPGFYDEVWRARAGVADGREGAPADRALGTVVADLRKAGVTISPADLIATRTTAGGLAALRGHAEVWRRDLVDGVTGALVKDEIALGVSHPVLDAVHRALRGSARGRLAEAAPRPPFVVDLNARLEAAGLLQEARPRTVDLPLREPDALERSRVLHAVRILDLPGYRRRDVHAAEASIVERWEVRREITFEGQAIEAAAYGTTLADAVSARLVERAAALEADAAAAAELLGAAVRAGVSEVAGTLAVRVHELVAADGDVGRAGEALGILLALYRYDRVLGAAGRADVGALLASAYDRTLWLLDPGGQATVEEDAGAAAVAAVLEAWERAPEAVGAGRERLEEVLGRLGDAEATPAGVRGAALGALWVLDAATGDELLAAMERTAGPAVLGDFLHGLFRLARDVVDRRPELLRALDRLVAGYADTAFLEAAPGLRRAFSVFTPREKDELARAILGRAEAAKPMALREVDVEAVERMMEIEAALAEAVERYGVRGAA